MLNLVYRKLAEYEYSLSNFYKKISARDDEYSAFFNQLSIDEKKHSKMLFALLDKRKEKIPTKYLVESIQLSNPSETVLPNKIKNTNIGVSKNNLLFRLIFKNKAASSYSTYELLSFIRNGEKIAYIYYSLLLYIVKFLYLVTSSLEPRSEKNEMYKLDIHILSHIREEEKNHSQHK